MDEINAPSIQHIMYINFVHRSRIQFQSIKVNYTLDVQTLPKNYSYKICSYDNSIGVNKLLEITTSNITAICTYH